MTVNRQVGQAAPVVRILALSVAALVVFGLTVLVLAQALAWGRGVPVGENLIAGTVCALIAWLIIARFHIRRHAATLRFQDRETFFANVKTHLGDLGYQPRKESEDALVFRPSFHSSLFGGGITVQADGATAQVVGPKVYVERLQKRLRNQSFLEPLQKSLASSRRVTP